MKKWSRIILIMMLTLTLTACKGTTYTVSFNTDGGTAVDSQKVKENETVPVPTTPTKDGHTFDAWYTANEVKYDFSAKVTESFTLYAKWIQGNAYVVTFNTDGGSYIESQTVAENAKVTRPTTVPTKDGYTFVRWELNGSEYNFNSPVTANVTLKAVWKEGSETTTTKKPSTGDSTTKKTTTKKNSGSKATTTTKKPGSGSTTTTQATTTEAPKANVYYYTITQPDASIPQWRIYITLNNQPFTGVSVVYNQLGLNSKGEAAFKNSNGYYVIDTDTKNASTSYRIVVGGTTYTLVKK